jgi:hypothetical protein
MAKSVPSFVVDVLVDAGWNRVDKRDAWVREGSMLLISPSSVSVGMYSVEWSRMGLVKVRFLNERDLFDVIRNGGF